MPAASPGKNGPTHEQLEAGLDSGDIRLFYQPIVRLRDHYVIGHEALARWNGWRLDQWLPNMISSDLELRWYSLQLQAICQKIQRDRYRQIVSWNLSPSGAENPETGELITRTLQAYGVSGNRLWIEVSENAPLLSIGTINIRHLHRNHHPVLADDYPRGYSRNRNAVPAFQGIKFSCDYIWDALAKQKYWRELEREVAAARRSKWITIAEGVETEQQAKRLLSIGVTYGQGFYFGKPIDCDVLTPDLEQV